MISDCQKLVVERRNAVFLIARRHGYSVEDSEDFAQSAALMLVKNPKRSSQSSAQAFIDVLRALGKKRPKILYTDKEFLVGHSDTPEAIAIAKQTERGLKQ
jgi:hypothetical protein